MRFLANTCRCGADLASAEPEKVLYRGKGKDREPYAECPAGCGRTYLLTDEPAPATPEPEAEPEDAGVAGEPEGGEEAGEEGEEAGEEGEKPEEEGEKPEEIP